MTIQPSFLSLLLFSLSFLLPFLLQAQTFPATAPASAPAIHWKVTKEKKFPLYKVQILTQSDSSETIRPDAMKAVIYDLQGKILAEIKGFSIEPDPKINVEGWVPGTLLDFDKDGYEDLMLRVFSGGAHCCHNYEIYSLGKTLKKLGSLKLRDCGGTLQLKDLNQDGPWEILTCNAHFTYLKDIPYAKSPFPPMIFGLERTRFVNQDKKYPQVFDEDIQNLQKDLQEKGYADELVLQIVLDHLLSGREAQAWEEFDKLYVSPNKEQMKTDLQERWRKYSGGLKK